MEDVFITCSGCNGSGEIQDDVTKNTGGTYGTKKQLFSISTGGSKCHVCKGTGKQLSDVGNVIAEVVRYMEKSK